MTTSSETNQLSEVLKVEDRYYEDAWVYEWSNDRKHYSTDKNDTGIYDGN
jgi:hypothetical protein